MDTQVINVIFYIAVLIMSVIIHEISHGFMAEYYGDETARRAGRLTLNPIKHLDFFGSILLPVLLYYSTMLTGHPFTFGWAKPVPYNPNNLRDRKWGTIAVAAAGVLANLFVAVLFGLILRFTQGMNVPQGLPVILSLIVEVNLLLAIFNLVPIPPLDGSKILFNLLPRNFHPVVQFLERYSFVLLIVFIFFFSSYLFPILVLLFRLITGLNL